MEKTKKKTKSTFAQNIIEKRKSMGLSAEKLAERIGISHAALKLIETDKSGGSPKTRQAIADSLGCSLEELYDDHSQQSEIEAELARTRAAMIEQQRVVQETANMATELFREIQEREKEISRLQQELINKKPASPLKLDLISEILSLDEPMVRSLLNMIRNNRGRSKSQDGGRIPG